MPQSGLLAGEAAEREAQGGCAEWDWLSGLAPPELLCPGTAGPGSGPRAAAGGLGQSNEPTAEGKWDFFPLKVT